jgi:hypothetical protein
MAETAAEKFYQETIGAAQSREEDAFSRIEAIRLQAKLEETWFLLATETEKEEFLYTAEQINALKEGDSFILQGKEEIEIFPLVSRGEEVLFKTRYEIPDYDQEWQFPEAAFATTVCGWVDFIGGFPMDCIELLVAIGFETACGLEPVTTPDEVQPGDDRHAAPKPQRLFHWNDEERVLINKTAKREKQRAQWLVKHPGVFSSPGREPLHGELTLKRPHWFLRANLGENVQIVPGEFMGLGIRLMPDVPWGQQKSNPFIYSGAYIDTIYYTSGEIVKVNEPTDLEPYATYDVKWRSTEKFPDGTVTRVVPSDFAEYQEGDRVVCIMKGVAISKKSQLWKDNDTKEFGESWNVYPVCFYGLGLEEA